MPKDEEILVNHYGKYVSSLHPVTGVISIHSINWEFLEDGICLDCGQNWHGISEDETLDEYEKDKAYTEIDCSDHVRLVGDWKFDVASGEYIPDKTKEFSGIVSSDFSCVQVVWSKTIATGRRLCSPCFPGQVDLDSENGDFQGYTIPEELLYKEEVK